MTPKFMMSFDLGNEEFDEPFKRAEGIARLLRDTAIRVEQAQCDGTLFDINGNSIGHWGFDEIEQEDDGA